LRRVAVRLGARSYTIRVAPGLLAAAGKELDTLRLGRRLFVVSDTNVHPLYGPTLERSLRAASFRVDRLVLPPGEGQKSLTTLRRILDALVDSGADRSTTIVALGGGVVGDLAGFAAATWHRGVPYVQVPTTLLAQVDSSVGGKTGINLPAGKNLVGAFHQPTAVLADPSTLATLPPREYRAGLGEVIKYGMIRDERFFASLERDADPIIRRDPDRLASIVTRCCRMKAEYVVRDELDRSGRRAHLNYGHTFGHAVETATRYRRYRHGEAVALGMVAASRVSADLGRLSETDRKRLLALLDRFGLPTSGVPSDPDQLLRLFARDKKTDEGRLRIVLTKGIGSASVSRSVPRRLLLRALREICAVPRRKSPTGGSR